jgi:hypothetical protein
VFWALADPEDDDYSAAPDETAPRNPSLTLLATTVSGAAFAATDRAESVRFVSKPARVAQGGVVRVVVAVTPSSRRSCTGIFGRGGSGVAKIATARAGRATFTWSLTRTARLGQWKIQVLCGKAGSASASLTVVRPATAPAPVPARVVVDKSGFGYVDRTDYRAVGYGVVLRNVSPDEDAFDVQITINLVDAANRILKSGSDRIELVPAGTTYYYADRNVVTRSETPTKLEITVRVGERKKKAMRLPPVSNLRVFDDGFGSIYVAGEFSNPYTRPMPSFARVTVVAFDAAGNIIGGGLTYPGGEVPPGGRIGFETSIGGVSDASRIASTQASVEAEIES